MHIYFSAIGGVGIGPLAMIALDAGHTVSGSDLKNSEMTDYLRDRGIRISVGPQDGTAIASEHIAQPIDWFVYSSALPGDHAELKFAREHDIKATKRDEFLNFILDEKQLSLIAAAGTHGKTTTTGMLIWTLQKLGVPVSYSIGTSINFGPPAKYEPDSQYFIYECDEFDKNFLNFHPSKSIISSYDYDHADTYPTKEDYQYAFKDFVGQSKAVYLWNDAAAAIGIEDSPTASILSKLDPGISRIKLAGLTSRQNAWLVVQCIHGMLPNFDLNKIIEAINSFPGTNRRFEKLAENLYTDYGHHPTEIAATIEMASELNKSVVVVYQPHQNIRQHELIKERAYEHCFEGVKTTYWLPTYLSREYQDLPVLSATELMATTSPETKTEFSEMNDTLWRKIQDHLKNGDLVVAMSAGDLDHWLRQKADSET